LFPGAQKGFLGGIFRIVGIAQEEIAQPEYRLLKRLHQRFPGSQVAVCGASKQRGFVQ
jgi:hypothetical protein